MYPVAFGHSYPITVQTTRHLCLLWRRSFSYHTFTLPVVALPGRGDVTEDGRAVGGSCGRYDLRDELVDVQAKALAEQRSRRAGVVDAMNTPPPELNLRLRRERTGRVIDSRLFQRAGDGVLGGLDGDYVFGEAHSCAGRWLCRVDGPTYVYISPLPHGRGSVS